MILSIYHKWDTKSALSNRIRNNSCAIILDNGNANTKLLFSTLLLCQIYQFPFFQKFFHLMIVLQLKQVYIFNRFI